MLVLIEVKTPTIENTVLGLQEPDFILGSVLLCMSHTGPTILTH